MRQHGPIAPHRSASSGVALRSTEADTAREEHLGDKIHQSMETVLVEGPCLCYLLGC